LQTDLPATDEKGKETGMALSYKARRRWALIILLVGMPVYVVLAINLVDLFERRSMPVELAIYVGLGILWILPFRFIFRGIGQPDPNAKAEGNDPSA
jgi:predicted membrane channel-forming protein YqfA (hemolysin III family)